MLHMLQSNDVQHVAAQWDVTPEFLHSLRSMDLDAMRARGLVYEYDAPEPEAYKRRLLDMALNGQIEIYGRKVLRGELRKMLTPKRPKPASARKQLSTGTPGRRKPLTTDEIRHIKSLAGQGYRNSEIARASNVSKSTVSLILRGLIHKEIV